MTAEKTATGVENIHLQTIESLPRGQFLKTVFGPVSSSQMSYDGHKEKSSQTMSQLTDDIVARTKEAFPDANGIIGLRTVSIKGSTANNAAYVMLEGTAVRIEQDEPGGTAPA